MTTPSVSFNIPGPPVGKGRPKFARRGAHVHAFTPQKTENYENLVKMAAREAMKSTSPFTGPLRAIIYATKTPPQSWSKKKQQAALAGLTAPTSTPDADNIAKAILDACNGIVFHDDKQVCDLIVRKRYSDVAGTSVTIKEAELSNE